MKTLYLLRHGDAETDSSRGDHARVLTEAGRQEADRVRRFLMGNGFALDFVLSSSAARTRETAQIVTGQNFASENGDSWLFERTLYQVPYKTVLDHIRLVSANVDHLLVVNHNPTISETALVLDDGRSEHLGFFPTAGLAVFSCDLDRWQDLDSACVELKHFFTP